MAYFHSDTTFDTLELAERYLPADTRAVGTTVYIITEDKTYTWGGVDWELQYAGIGGGGVLASLVSYDNSNSGLSATNVQDALDEIVADSANFLLLDGSRAMLGDLDLGSFSINNVDNIDATTLSLSGLTTDRVLVIDSGSNVTTSIVTILELSYLSGATSNIQLQLDTIEGEILSMDLATVLGIGNVTGGTNLIISSGDLLLVNSTVQSGHLEIFQVNGVSYFTDAIYIGSEGLISFSPGTSFAISSTSNDMHLGAPMGKEVNFKIDGNEIFTVRYTGAELTFGDLILYQDPTLALHAATKQYVDGLVVGLWDDRGNFNASGGSYPSSGGSGTGGAILKGDIWTISVSGTLPIGQVVEPGDTVRALIDSPGNTQANWAIGQNNIGYTPITNVLNSGNIIVGNASNVATQVTMSGDITINNTGVTAIGNLKVTNAMLAGLITASKLVGTDIATVGTITTGTWQGTSISTTYTDAKIKGSIGATAGLIAFGTGTSDTVTTSSKFYYDVQATYNNIVSYSTNSTNVIQFLAYDSASYWISTRDLNIYSSGGYPVIISSGVSGGNMAMRYETGSIRLDTYTNVTGAFNAANYLTIGGNTYIGGNAVASAKLHVVSTTEQLRLGYDATYYFNATVSSTGQTVFTINGTTVGTWSTAGNLTIGQSLFTPSGAVGIGPSAAPDSFLLLDIFKSQNNATYQRLINQNTGASAYAGINFQNSSTSAWIYKLSTNAAWNTGVYTAAALVMDNTGDTILNSTTAVKFGISGNEISRVNSIGLGIGTTPSFSLHISTSSSSLGTIARILQTAGATSNSAYIALELYQQTAGQGQSLKLATSFSNPLANSGLNSFAHATTIGYNISGYYEALGGNISVGVVGKSITAKNSATNIGVIGIADNTGTSPILVGGYFGLKGSDNPTFASGALICDNGSSTANIFAAYDNGSLVARIADGGGFEAVTIKATTAAGYISSDGSTGASGTFTTVDSKTVTVKDGIITSIV